jgi:hypothetical protein
MRGRRGRTMVGVALGVQPKVQPIREKGEELRWEWQWE